MPSYDGYFFYWLIVSVVYFIVFFVLGYAVYLLGKKITKGAF